MVLWDLNEVLALEEHVGGRGCLSSMEEMRNWVFDIRLQDIPLIGRKFMRSRGRSRSRLDRAMVKPKWGMKFPDLKLVAFPN